MELMNKQTYEAEVTRTRAERMAWWNEARYGMFVHWGLYAFHGRNEWVQLAVDAGMKYMVLTSKHHEGFCLWGHQADHVQLGPGLRPRPGCGVRRDRPRVRAEDRFLLLAHGLAPSGRSACGRYSQRGNSLYLWVRCWPGSEIPTGGFKTRLKSARFLVGGQPVQFTQEGYRFVPRDLPETSPDTLAGADRVSTPRQRLAITHT